MFDRWLKLPAHHYLYLTGLTLIVVGLPLNRVVLSTGCIWVVVNWILEGGFSEKWKKLKSTQILFPIYILLIFHIIGLFWADDFAYAMRDLKIKLPFFSIPLIVASSKQLKQNYIHFFLTVFLAVLSFTTFLNYGFYHDWWGNANDTEGAIRQMAFFISHIRLSWMLVLGVVVCFYLLLKQWINRWMWILIVLWMIFYLYASQSMTGFVFLAIAFLTTLIYIVFFQKKLWIRFAFIAILISLFSFTAWKINAIFHQQNQVQKVDLKSLDKYSAQGNRYFNDVDVQAFENGNRVFIYFAEDEMICAWNQRSNFSAKGEDQKGNALKYTLARYLTSYGYRKDSVGVYKLSEQDIKNVERGMSNHLYTTEGMFYRVADIMHTFFTEQDVDPNGRSILQRKEHYKATINIIQNHFWFGVTNGDLNKAYKNAYKNIDSDLKEKYRHRAHNQYLTFWVSFGVLGFYIFVVFVFTTLIKTFKRKEYLPIVFAVMLLFIAASEDVLETQTGVCFVAFFLSIFLFKEKNDAIE